MATATAVPQEWQRKRILDRQYAAAAIVFDAVPRCWAYCDFNGVAKDELLDAARAWSHGEQILVKVALDLFDPGCVADLGHVPAHLGEIVGVLGEPFYRVFKLALFVARGSE